MSREKSEKVCITFRLSEEEHEKLKQYSSACGLSAAEFMRQLCRGNAPQPMPQTEFWELLVLMFHLMVASPFPVVATMMSVVLKKQYLGKKKEGNPLLFYSSFLFSF